MLDWLAETRSAPVLAEAGARLREATLAAVIAGEARTGDLGGAATTEAAAAAVRARLDL